MRLFLGLAALAVSFWTALAHEVAIVSLYNSLSAIALTF
jgi:hypothetical protein